MSGYISARHFAQEVIADELVRILGNPDRPLNDADAILTALVRQGLYVGVAFTIGMLLGATEARADTLQQEAVRQSNAFAVLAIAAIAVVSLMNLGFGAAKWLFRLGDWVWQNRPPSRRERAEAEALQEALEAKHAAEREQFEAWERAVREALDANRNRSIASYEPLQSELASADDDLRDDRLAETVRQWSKEVRP